MSAIDTLIYDRSANEVGRNSKGSYNASDLNRVGEACAELYATLTRYGYSVPGYTALKTDWGIGNIPTAAQMETYLATVAALKAAILATQELPETMEHLTVEGANNIERLLAEIDLLIRRMVRAFLRTAQANLYSSSKWRGIPTSYSDYGRTWAELDAMETTWRNWNAATWYLLLYGNLKAEA